MAVVPGNRYKPTVEALAELDPEVIIPAHCTGWRAAHALAEAMPHAFIPNSVGSRLELRNGDAA